MLINRKEFIFKTMGLFSFLSLGKNIWAEEVPVLRKKSTPIKSVLFINMVGGMSHIDTLDYKPNSQFLGIKSSIGVNISEVFPNIAKILKYFTLIRSVNSDTGDHERAQYLLHTGKNLLGGFKDAPSFGAIIAKALEQNKDYYFPNHITIGKKEGMIGEAGFLGNRYKSFHISNVKEPLSNVKNKYHWLDSSRFLRREMFLDFLDENFHNNFYSNHIEVGKEYFRMAVDFMNSEKISVFNWKEEKESSIKNYTTSDFGIALLIAKRCIREQIPFIQVSLSGWDTHNNNKERIQKLANEVDLPLYHFVNELKSEGLWQQTLIYLNSEFGRKPEIAPNGDGRDHHPKVWSCLLGGGKIPENHVVGESDKEGKYPLKEPVSINDLLATIYSHVGIDPYIKLYTSDKRPYILVQNGELIL
jgi:hypothetical protein